MGSGVMGGGALTPEQAANLAAQKAAAEQKAAEAAKVGTLQLNEDTGLLEVYGGVNKYGINRPGQLTLRDRDGGLATQFTETMGESLQALKDKAMAEGDTAAARLARERQELMRQEDVDRLRAMQATGVTQGMRNLATRGGVSAGSRERLARDATRDAMRGFQGIGRENRMANLQISQADEAMKNKLLGQTGLAEQTIQSANIGRLADDIRNQNLGAQAFYKEDMAAYGAQQTAKAQRKSSGGCFAGDSEVRMKNGELRPIAFIRLQDELFEGGKVTATMKFISDDLYDYKGVRVTGEHAVKEDGTWIRVKDSEHKTKIDGKHVVYNLNCEGHNMIINDMVFADYDETDFGSSITDDQSLKVLNGQLA